MSELAKLSHSKSPRSKEYFKELAKKRWKKEKAKKDIHTK